MSFREIDGPTSFVDPNKRFRITNKLRSVQHMRTRSFPEPDQITARSMKKWFELYYNDHDILYTEARAVLHCAKMMKVRLGGVSRNVAHLNPGKDTVHGAANYTRLLEGLRGLDNLIDQLLELSPLLKEKAEASSCSPSPGAFWNGHEKNFNIDSPE